MNIVILNGSPRDGNTRTLLKEVEKGMIGHISDVNMVFVDLNDKFIKPCDACQACAKLGGKCIHKDDTNDLISLITDADTIIFGTPVYWWGMTTQLKSIIDKFYSWHGIKYNVKGKKIGVISVGGAGVSDPQYKLISDQFKYISNFLQWDIIFDEAYQAYEIGDIQSNSNAIKSCFELYKHI